jgi:hypothetical protein
MPLAISIKKLSRFCGESLSFYLATNIMAYKPERPDQGNKGVIYQTNLGLGIVPAMPSL